MFLALAKEHLRENKIKLTKSRLSLLELFASNEKPITAYRIKEQLKEEVDVTTIYRNIELFERIGLIHKVNVADGYRKCCFLEKKGVHSFMICEKCNDSEEFILPQMCNSHEKEATKQSNFHCNKHIYEITGKCAKCIN